MTEENKSTFQKLSGIDIQKHVEKKKAGYNEISYLSWTWAWGELKRQYPDANYEIKKFEHDLPYVYDVNTGYMVFTSVTIQGMTHEMMLPVMDSQNRSMKSAPYTFKTKNGEKKVEQATMFDINKAIMRCLVKNIAMFGLGINLYAGEDLPFSSSEKVSPEKVDKLEDMINEIEKLKGMDLFAFYQQKLNVKSLNDVTNDIYGRAYKMIEGALMKARAQEKAKEQQEQKAENKGEQQ